MHHMIVDQRKPWTTAPRKRKRPDHLKHILSLAQLRCKENMSKMKNEKHGPPLNIIQLCIVHARTEETGECTLPTIINILPASQLNEGNQRKLSLTIALMGNLAVVLIDEFSTAAYAKKNVLANKVGILAVRLLTIGTTESLSTCYATYKFHFTCRTREDITRMQTVMSAIPGAWMTDNIATRLEVPIERGNGLTLAKLFHLLSARGDFSEYTVEKETLESVFLKVIRENNMRKPWVAT
ncbi:hypothetical protein DFH08DRAFT_1002809 [Mycena albidolilacea]|uniref:Uncharacterized protein n=1 Tax=Mycena albidolilacea TaxID=1033008 RepID=A0AAD7AQJ3_9AGAR|nr:hypothetical protein DFH08DRAFT_1002809 [Mycena albidolilacea]